MAYEILLMRLFSIGQWHHFAYMIISVALLGFGASGSLLFLILHQIRRNMEKWLVILSGLTAVSFPLAYSLSQKVPVRSPAVGLATRPVVEHVSHVSVHCGPFLLAGGVVGAILAGAGKDTHRMYAADLLGPAAAPSQWCRPFTWGLPGKSCRHWGSLVLCGFLGVV